jgi:hypothetical protein
MSLNAKKSFLTSYYYNVNTPDNWAINGNNIYNINSGNVGVNTTTPAAILDVSGQTILRTPAVRIGVNAGSVNQTTFGIAIGTQAGQCNQDISGIAIGLQAGQLSQGRTSIAIGLQAGQSNQGTSAIAIGNLAGQVLQGESAVAMGQEAGQFGQSLGSIAIGYQAGEFNQGLSSVAVGFQAGQFNQDISAIAIGSQAGFSNQGRGSIAIGTQAGMTNMGSNSICIGRNVNTTFANTIAINASESQFITDTSGFFVRSLDISAGSNNYLVYNPTTGRISYNVTSTKSFVIDHPLNNEKYLVHACLEGPEAGVYYRGKSEITNNEFVDITLPDYTHNFEKLSVQLTPIQKYNELSSEFTELNQNNKIRVYGNNGKFFWTVFLKRYDIITEPLKNSVQVHGDGPYKFI